MLDVDGGADYLRGARSVVLQMGGEVWVSSGVRAPRSSPIGEDRNRARLGRCRARTQVWVLTAVVAIVPVSSPAPAPVRA